MSLVNTPTILVGSEGLFVTWQIPRASLITWWLYNVSIVVEMYHRSPLVLITIYWLSSLKGVSHIIVGDWVEICRLPILHYRLSAPKFVYGKDIDGSLELARSYTESSKVWSRALSLRRSDLRSDSSGLLYKFRWARFVSTPKAGVTQIFRILWVPQSYAHFMTAVLLLLT